MASKQYIISSKELKELLIKLEDDINTVIEYLNDDDTYLFYGDITITTPYCEIYVKELFASTWHTRYELTITYF